MINEKNINRLSLEEQVAAIKKNRNLFFLIKKVLPEHEKVFVNEDISVLNCVKLKHAETYEYIINSVWHNKNKKCGLLILDALIKIYLKKIINNKKFSKVIAELMAEIVYSDRISTFSSLNKEKNSNDEYRIIYDLIKDIRFILLPTLKNKKTTRDIVYFYFMKLNSFRKQNNMFNDSDIESCINYIIPFLKKDKRKIAFTHQDYNETFIFTEVQKKCLLEENIIFAKHITNLSFNEKKRLVKKKIYNIKNISFTDFEEFKKFIDLFPTAIKFMKIISKPLRNHIYINHINRFNEFWYKGFSKKEILKAYKDGNLKLKTLLRQIPELKNYIRHVVPFKIINDIYIQYPEVFKKLKESNSFIACSEKAINSIIKNRQKIGVSLLEISKDYILICKYISKKGLTFLLDETRKEKIEDQKLIMTNMIDFADNVEKYCMDERVYEILLSNGNIFDYFYCIKVINKIMSYLRKDSKDRKKYIKFISQKILPQILKYNKNLLFILDDIYINYNIVVDNFIKEKKYTDIHNIIMLYASYIEGESKILPNAVQDYIYGKKKFFISRLENKAFDIKNFLIFC